MIGSLPEKLSANGREYKIKSTDFRVALIVLQAFNDPNLTNDQKAFITLDALIGIEKIEPQDQEEAFKACVWYLDGGKKYEDHGRHKPKLMDWEQDEQMIFSAVNHVANTEVRALSYMHWWTFLGYFNEISDGLFSTILMIRQKKAKKKKLTKWEQEFYAEHKDEIDIKTKYSDAELKEREALNRLLDS